MAVQWGPVSGSNSPSGSLRPLRLQGAHTVRAVRLQLSGWLSKSLQISVWCSAEESDQAFRFFTGQLPVIKDCLYFLFYGIMLEDTYYLFSRCLVFLGIN